LASIEKLAVGSWQLAIHLHFVTVVKESFGGQIMAVDRNSWQEAKDSWQKVIGKS
jgi:hypothetical protein